MPRSGRTLKSWVTPGSGKYGRITPTSTVSGGPRREMGGRQVLDGGAGVGETVPDGAGDRRDRPLYPRARRPHARPRVGQRLPVVRRIRRPAHLQAGSKDGTPVAKIQLTKEDPEPHGLDIKDGVLWYCDAASSWIW